MSYSEKVLVQVLIKLHELLGSKIISNNNSNPLDAYFMVHLRNYLHKTLKIDLNAKETQNNIQPQLKNFLRKGKVWEKMETTVEDVSVIKVPLKKQEKATLRLVIELLKRDIDVKNSEVFHKLSEICNSPQVFTLIKEIDNINSMKIWMSS